MFLLVVIFLIKSKEVALVDTATRHVSLKECTARADIINQAGFEKAFCVRMP